MRHVLSDDPCPACGRLIRGTSNSLLEALSDDGTSIWCCTICGQAAPRLCPARREHRVIAIPCGHENPDGLNIVTVEDYIAGRVATSPSPTGTRAHLTKQLHRASKGATADMAGQTTALPTPGRTTTQ